MQLSFLTNSPAPPHYSLRAPPLPVCCAWNVIRVRPLAVKCESGGAQCEHTPVGREGKCHRSTEAPAAIHVHKGGNKKEMLGGKSKGGSLNRKGGSVVIDRGDISWGRGMGATVIMDPQGQRDRLRGVQFEPSPIFSMKHIREVIMSPGLRRCLLAALGASRHPLGP